VSVRYQRKLTT